MVGFRETFEDAALPPAVLANVARCKYERATPIQRHAIPLILDGHDLMACAPTGSGKTVGAFLGSPGDSALHSESGGGEETYRS